GSGTGAPVARQSVPARSASQPVDGGWPRVYDTVSGARLVIYEPQIASWTDQKHMVLYAAVSYQPQGKPSPMLGTIRVDADTSVSVPERLVNFSELTITAVNFPTLERDQLGKLAAEISSSVPRNERVIGLDRVLAAINASAEIRPKNMESVRADPPVVFYSETPAVLVNIDGDPIWSPIKDSDLNFAVNTNWDLFEYPPSTSYYLRNDAQWLKAANVDGPWTSAGELPVSFSKLPDDENWKDVKAALAARKTTVPHVPTVFVSRK